MSFEKGNVVKYNDRFAVITNINPKSITIKLINTATNPLYNRKGEIVEKKRVKKGQLTFVAKDEYTESENRETETGVLETKEEEEPFTVSTKETIESKEEEPVLEPTSQFSPLKQNDFDNIKKGLAKAIIEEIRKMPKTASNKDKLRELRDLFNEASKIYDFLQLPQIIKLVTDELPELKSDAEGMMETSSMDSESSMESDISSMSSVSSMPVQRQPKMPVQEQSSMPVQATYTPARATTVSSDVVYGDEDPKQVGKYLRPDGTPCLYQNLFSSIFQGYSIDAFREHIKDKHPELVRKMKPDPKQKPTFYRNSVVGFLKSVGAKILGMYRAVPQTKVGTENYVDEIFQEQEDLFELMYFVILKPHLSKKMVQPDILQQDVAATSPGLAATGGSGPSGPSGPYRVGAIIDVEKLGINLGMLKSVLEGRPQQMMPSGQPSEPSDASSSSFAPSTAPSDAGKDMGKDASDQGSLEPSGDNKVPDLRPPVQPSRGDAQPAQPNPKQMKVKKENKTTFVPSRKRVLESARRLTIKRQPRVALKRLGTPSHHPYQLNYYAPHVVEQVPSDGVYKAFE